MSWFDESCCTNFRSGQSAIATALSPCDVGAEGEADFGLSSAHAAMTAHTTMSAPRSTCRPALLWKIFTITNHPFFGATAEKRSPINNTSIPRAFHRLPVQRGSSSVQATGRCGATNEKRHVAEACRRMPTAPRTLMIVERLGLPSALSARYKLSRLSPESRATLLIPRARAISPSARAMPVASSGASASHASRYAAISFGVRNCAAMS